MLFSLTYGNQFLGFIRGVGHVIFSLQLVVGQLALCRKEEVGHVFFNPPHFKMLHPPPPTTPPYTFWPVPYPARMFSMHELRGQ